MNKQVIGSHETAWFNPAILRPPFNMKLLLMVAGSRSEDCGRTFEIYTAVLTASVQKTSPSDEYDDTTAIDEFEAGDRTDFMEYQFHLHDHEGEVLDWYSDSIVAWAYYPVRVGQEAVELERARHASALDRQ